MPADNRSNSPLYSGFATPFTEPNARPVIPEYTLPAAYTVTNVPPLHTKMSSFSDETLFAIFYQYPRDIMQEIAAGELYGWRFISTRATLTFVIDILAIGDGIKNSGNG